MVFPLNQQKDGSKKDRYSCKSHQFLMQSCFFIPKNCTKSFLSLIIILIKFLFFTHIQFFLSLLSLTYLIKTILFIIFSLQYIIRQNCISLIEKLRLFYSIILISFISLISADKFEIVISNLLHTGIRLHFQKCVKIGFFIELAKQKSANFVVVDDFEHIIICQNYPKNNISVSYIKTNSIIIIRQTFKQNNYYISMNNQYPGWGRHAGGRHHGYHHGRDRRGYQQGNQQVQQGYSQHRRHHGHHGSHKRHRQAWNTPNHLPIWQGNSTGYNWDYGYSTPQGDKKILEKSEQNSQIKSPQIVKNVPTSQTKNAKIQMKVEVKEGRQPPAFIVCPIAQTVMVSPVILMSCGHTFDQKYIREWLKRSNNCPMCKKESNQSFIIKNYSLVEAIQHYNANK